MESIPNIYGNDSQVAARSTTTEMVVSRQAQEVQAAMVIAKRFPRNEVESYNKIINACKRRTLAEQAMYEYQRGDTKVTGPSIRLAEAMAQYWGNLNFGFMELEQRSGESQVMTYAWDLETNTRQTKIFSVPHIRETKKGNIRLTKPRDIYEEVANKSARRVRACILGVIPGDVIDAAIAQCNATLLGDNSVPLVDLVRQVVNTFGEKHGVTAPMLEKYIGCKSESFTMNDLMRLKKVHRSLLDGMADREDYFEMLPLVADAEVSDPFKDEKGKPGKGKGKEKQPEPEKKGEDQIDPGFIPPEGDQNLPFV